MITISNNGSNVICAWVYVFVALNLIFPMNYWWDVDGCRCLSDNHNMCIRARIHICPFSVCRSFPLLFSHTASSILEHIHVSFDTYTQNSDLQLSKTLNSARKSMFTSIRSTVQTTYHRLDFHKPICTISILINLKTLTINIFHSLTKSHPVAHSLFHSTYCFD